MKKAFFALLALIILAAGYFLFVFDINKTVINKIVLHTPVQEGISAEEVDESIAQLALNEGLLHAGVSRLYKQIREVTGREFRHVSIHSLCDAKTAAVLLDESDSYIVLMPCTIGVVEAKDGSVSMWSMNPEIIGVLDLSPEAKKMAESVASKMLAILDGAAEGAF